MAERLTQYDEDGRWSEAATRPVTDQESEIFIRLYRDGESKRGVAASMGISLQEVTIGSIRPFLNMIYRAAQNLKASKHSVED